MSAGSVYVFVQSGSTWMQQQELTASDAAGADDFGYSVGISGDSLVVWRFDTRGGESELCRGGVCVCAVWEHVDSTAGTHRQRCRCRRRFGISVGISGDSLVVGAFYTRWGAMSDAGAAYVFVLSGSTWSSAAGTHRQRCR